MIPCSSGKFFDNRVRLEIAICCGRTIGVYGYSNDDIFCDCSLVVPWALSYSSTSSITIPTFLGKQPVAKADKQIKYCTDKERNALLDFKAGLQDPFDNDCISAWGTKKEDVHDDDCCNWSRVTCNNQTGHVTELHLDYCFLEGEISPSLLNLTYLTLLDLSWNSFNGTIPNSIGSLTQLRYLDLNFNSFNGSVPVSIGSLTQLRYLDLSYNCFSGTIPKSIGSLTELTHLDLSQNYFNGSIPVSIGSLTQLRYLDLSYNSFSGTIPKFIGSLTELTHLDLSFNSFNRSIPVSIGSLTQLRYLEGVPVTYENHMPNLSYAVHIDLSSCKLGPQFPTWIQTLKNLVHLDIANNRISDTVPIEFWDTWSSQLSYLNLSSNNLSGEVPNLLSNFDHHSTIDLSSNSFYGPIPNVSSTLEVLNLSKNKFHGGISFLCHLNESLSFLDLSHNSLTGQVPDCLWHFKELKVLSLGDNSLAGSLPPFLGYLVQLEVLSLYNNSFSGELPLFIKNCQSLKFLDLGANMFSGDVPIWIGENLFGLYVFSLRSNNFSGTMPLQLCELVNLQILDLSMNNLQGTIPSCVNKFSSMFGAMVYPDPNVHHFNTKSEYVDHEMIQWQGIIREFSSNLGLLMSIDLSSNNLTGQVPHELTDIYQLVTLNLSKNALFGEIPPKIGEMKHLLTLDLSRNKFSGGIPSSMSQMTSLNYLDVSYNSLSGRIPSSTQLQSFEISSCTGNAGLCGLPLSKYCPGDEELQVPSPIGEREGGGEGDKDELERWFYIGEAIGFAIGFWIVCSTLLVNRRGRHTFFHFMDSLENCVYVKVVAFKAKFQRAAHVCIS